MGKIFLDEQGLAFYDQLIKSYIDAGDDRAKQAEAELLAALNALGEASNEENEKNAEAIQANADAIAENKTAIEENKTAIEENKAAIEENAAAIAENKDALDKLNGDADVEGSVANQVQSAVTDLVDGAPEMLDTLKEIADWIANDETGTSALIDRVKDAEDAIEALNADNDDLKEYVDEQDKAYYDSINAIEMLKIKALFPTVQAADEAVVDAIANLEEGAALKLAADQNVAEDLVISKSCYIDANGATFTGTVTVPADVDVIIENATFSKPVVVA